MRESITSACTKWTGVPFRLGEGRKLPRTRIGHVNGPTTTLALPHPFTQGPVLLVSITYALDVNNSGDTFICGGRGGGTVQDRPLLSATAG